MLETECSHAGNKIFPRWEQNIPKVGLFSTYNSLDVVELIKGFKRC